MTVSASKSGVVDLAALLGKNEESSQEKKAFKPSKFWVNVGIKKGDKLVALPMGIPLDGLKAKPIPGKETKNPEFRQLRVGENQLWKLVEEQMAKMQDGEEVELTGFTVILRKSKEKEDVESIDTSENPFAITSLS